MHDQLQEWPGEEEFGAARCGMLKWGGGWGRGEGGNVEVRGGWGRLVGYRVMEEGWVKG